MRYYFLALGVIVAVCVGCAAESGNVFDRGEYAAPPAGMMQRPGPAVDGPGPGVFNFALGQPPAPVLRTTQVRFVSPRSMRVGWQVGTQFVENQLVTPGRYNFPQGATYRLKLTNIPEFVGEVLYPTLQVFPAHPNTDAYLTHNSIPIELTIDDLDQVTAGNYVTKVIYLPDPRFQDLAIGDVETLVSTKLAPGADPVVEAEKRGTIMAVLRVGNMDYEMPGAFGTPLPGAPAVPPGGPAGPIPPLPGPGAGAGGMEPGPTLSAPGGLEMGQTPSNGPIQQTQFQTSGGPGGQFVPPTPIASMAGGSGAFGVPGEMIVGGLTPPGLPPMHPIAGMGPIPPWGMPYTGTPIGLPGPAHIPLGRDAGLASHTVLNTSKNHLPEPVHDFVMEVKHEPGFRLPEPVRHVEYTETHPMYLNGETSWPKWSGR